MIVMEDNFEVYLKDETYIALGSFDGLHLGHMSLVNEAVKLARKNHAKSMVFTFKFHPRRVINKNDGPKILMSNESKLKVLKNAGLDIINMASFDSNFMKIGPERFIAQLVNNYMAKGLIVGFNYRFGYKNMGNIEQLQQLSHKYKFSLKVIEQVKYNGEAISSSIIRGLISEAGDVKKANGMLGRPFMLSGLVVHGKHLGIKLGFPTANLAFDEKFVIPQIGVYFTFIEYKGKYYKGITNVGYNPTTHDNKLSIETNILNFKKNIYNEKLKIYFIERIRDQVKFDSLEDLSEQIGKDKEYAYKQKLQINF